MLILILLFIAIFFCHSLVRLCLLIVRGPPPDDEPPSGPDPFPQLYTPGGYAVPQQPIPVVLARDEEAAGIESEATKSNPPAYGIWRESVVCFGYPSLSPRLTFGKAMDTNDFATCSQRVDPNRIYWMRNETSSTSASQSATSAGSSAPTSRAGDTSAIGNENSNSSSRPGTSATRRPPSYASEDGVEYVVEARPRSIAPTGAVPLAPHPSEVGRAGEPSQW